VGQFGMEGRRTRNGAQNMHKKLIRIPSKNALDYMKILMMTRSGVHSTNLSTRHSSQSLHVVRHVERILPEIPEEFPRLTDCG